MTLLVLSYSTSWCQSSPIPSTGEVIKSDSAIVSLEAIKIANSKMIELKLEKEINAELNSIIDLDSVIIKELSNKLVFVENENKQSISIITQQRNKAIYAGSTCCIVLLILLILSI